MLGGFGAIRAMQDSLKMNRAQNKRHRKTAKELAESHPAKSSGHKAHLISDPKKVSEHKKYIIAKRKKERTLSIVILATVIIIGILMISIMFI